LFEGKNKSVYIHGFTQYYVKVKTFWNPDLVNTKHKIIVDEIDQDGLVKIDFIKELKAILR
jgi:threonylcarbamoyladenosine tRNA methylthiotransferase MtaB